VEVQRIMDREKKQFRKLKRDIKRAGNKRRRLHLKRELHDNPEQAPHSEFDFGRNTSQTLNGLDQDATRRRPDRGGEPGPAPG
jgi:hypothetical protein